MLKKQYILLSARSTRSLHIAIFPPRCTYLIVAQRIPGARHFPRLLSLHFIPRRIVHYPWRALIHSSLLVYLRQRPAYPPQHSYTLSFQGSKLASQPAVASALFTSHSRASGLFINGRMSSIEGCSHHHTRKLSFQVTSKLLSGSYWYRRSQKCEALVPSITVSTSYAFTPVPRKRRSLTALNKVLPPKLLSGLILDSKT
jgi:hypothetical protein